MSRRLNECLKDTFSREYILPFFWQHGESHEVLEKEMEAIRASGITEMCVESRPHEEFGKDKWWDDFGYILQYAQKHDMKVWLLDDKHFPTGYANGYVKEHPELAQVTMTVEYKDILSEGVPVSLLAPVLGEGESFVRIVALRRIEKPGEAARMGKDSIVLDAVPVNGFVRAELPRGVWRVFYLIRSRSRHHIKNYIDMLNPESTKAMLYAVYEPHFEHFGQYFGNTFKGFFSDEPCFGNDNALHFGHLGNMKTIPWRNDLPEWIAEKTGMSAEQVYRWLPALFQDVEAVTQSLRFAYMDTVTQLYRQNFSNMLGDWCRARGVMYIGHIIEDSGAHLALGCSCGHYFRGLDGQDMAGIDIVLHEMIPGILENIHTACLSVGVADPSLYHYLLGKLASSHAHIDEKKKGRAMCEVFGAFGWAEGLPMMKKLADHFLSCGINYFVPHAFSPMKDDPDCPPYFYNQGDNPQFALFGSLMRYMQRTAHLLSGGTHRADVAVLYSTGRWASPDVMPNEAVTKVLTQAQIEFDIIPEDYLLERCTADGVQLRCGAQTYGAIIVPRCGILPLALRRKLDEFCCAGIPVCFVDEEPSLLVERDAVFVPRAAVSVVKLERLASFLRKKGLVQLTISGRHPHVRYYHMEQTDGDVYLFLNEDAENTEEFTFPCAGEVRLYDAYENRLYRPQLKRGRVRLRLEPFGVALVVCGKDLPDAPMYACGEEGEWQSVETKYTVSVCSAGESEYRRLYTTETLNGVDPAGMPDMTAVRYDFSLPQVRADRLLLDLGAVGETAELWINGEYVGARIAGPYRFDISGRLDRASNDIAVRVLVNQVYRKKDGFSQYLPAALPGICGKLRLCAYDERVPRSADEARSR